MDQNIISIKLILKNVECLIVLIIKIITDGQVLCFVWLQTNSEQTEESHFWFWLSS